MIRSNLLKYKVPARIRTLCCRPHVQPDGLILIRFSTALTQYITFFYFVRRLIFNKARSFESRLYFHLQARKALCPVTKNTSTQGQIRLFPSPKMEARPAPETQSFIKDQTIDEAQKTGLSVTLSTLARNCKVTALLHKLCATVSFIAVFTDAATAPG